MPVILSIQVGQPATRGDDRAPDPLDHEWTSAIFKSPVPGPVWMRRLNIDGDAQADLKNHGGADKAALAYGASRYDYWRRDLPDVAWVHGAFGENLTIDGLTEDDVCIGDVYAIGAARVEVSQQRSPCWKLARRWHIKDLAARVQKTGYTGWYLRVLAEGEIAPDMEITLVDRPYPHWTITQAQHIAHRRDAEAVQQGYELAECAALSEAWRIALIKRTPRADSKDGDD
jgi:MOSC domain-containing protein YiiM